MMGVVIDSILYLIISFLDFALPVLNLPPSFIIQVDNAVAFIVNLLNSAGYFIPLGVLGICFTVILTIDMAALGMRVAQWVVKIIRG